MSDCSINAFKMQGIARITAQEVEMETSERKAQVLDILEQAKRELKSEFEHDRALSLTLTKLDEAELWLVRTKEAK